MQSFDLIELQEEARRISTPKQLFDLWDQVCGNYEKGRIGCYELEEMKETIWPALRKLCRLQDQLNRAA